jgi:C1A family cysteine protease
MKRDKRVYGYVRDLPDSQDFCLRRTTKSSSSFPDEFSLTPQLPPIFDQGKIGSCVFNGIVRQHMFCQARQPGGITSMLSRLYGYYWVRWPNVIADSGCMPRDAFKLIQKRGLPVETLWPYVDDGKRYMKKPPMSCSRDAKHHTGLVYETVPQTQDDIMACLYGNGKSPYGFPIGFGAILYESFESSTTAKTGIVTLPKKNESEVGGHYQVIAGWKQIKGKLYFEIHNSWSVAFGDQGRDWMPAEYILDKDLVSDLRKLTLVLEDA